MLGHCLLSLGLVELLLKLLDLLVDEILSLLEKIVDGLLVVVVETEPDEAEEDGSIGKTADAHLSSKVDDEEEAEDHAKRERNGAEEDSIDADTKEGLDNTGDETEEAIDVLTRDSEVLVSKLARSFLTLEELDDAHDIEADGCKKSKEADPADEADDGEVVAEKEDKEDIDNAEDSKGDHEVVPHEDLLGLAEEFALLEGLADHVARAFTRAGSRGSLGSLLFLGSFLSGLGSGLFFLGFFCRGILNFFFRHLVLIN